MKPTRRWKPSTQAISRALDLFFYEMKPHPGWKWGGKLMQDMRRALQAAWQVDHPTRRRRG